MSFRIAKHIVKQNLGKAMIYFNAKPQFLQEHTENAFQELKKYEKPQTITTVQRKLQRGSPCKQRIKYREDQQRYYDQKKVGFFVCQVLAKKKMAVPLR